MTIRQYLARKKRIASFGVLICFAGGIAAIIFYDPSNNALITPSMVLWYIGAMACAIYMSYSLRCPKCRNNLGRSIQSPISIFGISAKLKYCPFCGIELDHKMEDIRTCASSGTPEAGRP